MISINNSKKSRTLINIIGLPVLLCLIYMGGVLFNLFVYLVIILAVKEFNDLIKHKNYSLNSIVLYCIVLFISIYQYYNMENLMDTMTNSFFLLLSFLFGTIIISICEIFRFKKTPLENISISGIHTESYDTGRWSLLDIDLSNFHSLKKPNLKNNLFF